MRSPVEMTEGRASLHLQFKKESLAPIFHSDSKIYKRELEDSRVSKVFTHKRKDLRSLPRAHSKE